MKNEKVKQKETKPHITVGSVFDDLGFGPQEALALKMKADLYRSVLGIIKKQGYSQRDLQRLLDQPQPRISELLNGKISKMSIEKLLGYLGLLGGSARIVVGERKVA